MKQESKKTFYTFVVAMDVLATAGLLESVSLLKYAPESHNPYMYVWAAVTFIAAVVSIFAHVKLRPELK